VTSTEDGAKLKCLTYNEVTLTSKTVGPSSYYDLQVDCKCPGGGGGRHTI